MANKCPCCKATNALAEAKKHPSLMAFKSAQYAIERAASAEAVDKILACATHGTKESFDVYVDSLMSDKSVIGNACVLHAVARLKEEPRP